MDKNPLQNRTEKNTRPNVYGLPKLRKKVVGMLGEAFVNNDLDMGEYEKRLKIANDAISVEDLENAVYDFPQARGLFPGQSQTVGQQHQQPKPNISPSPAHSLLENIKKADFLTVIGDNKISGPDIDQPKFKIVTGIGDSIVDLRDISYKFQHIEIENYCLIGDLKIRVPKHAEFKQRISIVIGGINKKQKSKSMMKRFFSQKPEFIPPPTSTPPLLVEITGFKLIGDVTIEYYNEEEY